MPDPQTPIALPDGTRIHFDATGDGPTVLLANVLYGHAGLFAGLVEDLSRDHRVITYDLRGTGRSSRHGPYEPAVDLADMEALLDHLGGVRVVVGVGDASLRAIRMALARPDLVGAVVTPGTTVLARADVARADVTDGRGLSGSGSVLSALVTLLASDYRSGIRSIVESGNPGLTEEEIRDRVEGMVAHCPQDVTIARLNFWRGDDVTEEARELGDRLWVLHYPGNPWFPEGLAEQIPAVLPDAHSEAIEDGPFARPEHTAAVVRRIIAAAA
jgi:pimeloyl-ACP methyl ester carboxylesterase